MLPREFADEVFRLWPKAFQPRDQWERELILSVTEFSVAQLESGLRALKMKRAGRAIDLSAIVDTCRAAAAATALPGSGLSSAFKRGQGDDITAFMRWLRSRGLTQGYGRLPMVEKVLISRLCAVLWGRPHWEETADEIAGDGENLDKLKRLVDRASGMSECQSQDNGGWYPPWADRPHGAA